MKPITIIGCGPGSPSYVLPAAVESIRMQQFICGSRRLLEQVKPHLAKSIELPVSISDAMSVISDLKKRGPTGVLVSGDPNLFSLSRAVKDQFPNDIEGVIPGIGAGQVALAKLGLSAEDSTAINLHSRIPAQSPNFHQPGSRLFYMGASNGYKWLLDKMNAAPTESSWYWCEDLTLSTERVCKFYGHDFDYMTANPNGRRLIIVVQTVPKGTTK